MGILPSKPAKDALVEWKLIFDKLILVRFRTRARNMSIVQCYAPTKTSDIYVCMSLLNVRNKRRTDCARNFRLAIKTINTK